MTRYNYLKEMHALCFRATNAQAVLGESGMMDFYSAAEEGFSKKFDELTKGEAEETITQSQIDQYIVLEAFTKEEEAKAAERLKEDAAEDEEAAKEEAPASDDLLERARRI